MKKIVLAFFLTLSMAVTASAQKSSVAVEPLACPIIGFHVAGLAPTQGPMFDLYKPPYLGFGIDVDYKFKNNLMLYVDGNIIMGANNLRDRVGRMPHVFSRDSVIIGANGVDANATIYNRGLSAHAGVGYILRLNQRNPNAGLLLRAGAGFMTQKTVFMLNDEHAPQVEDAYARLYDHRRAGFQLTEGIGYMFMSNHRNLLNVYALFEVSQLWSHSTRPYVIDELMGLRGPDNGRYFDLVYSIKLCWMVPLTGKPAREFYF